MRYQEKNFTLKDGRTVTLRSPVASDAAAMLQYLKQTSAETEQVLRYPEEWNITVEQEAVFLESGMDSPTDLKLSAFVGDTVVGNISINGMGDLVKIRHRASLGIGIIQDYWNCGLGTLLIQEALETMRNSPLEQIELGVFTNNTAAIHLYQKLGFREIGMIPRAYRLRNGTYCDELQMYYRKEQKYESIN